MPPRSHEPFLRAICESPADDAPRLVYADWLDEHGDPDRAEFIRLQCRLAQKGMIGDEAIRLSHRTQELFNLHRPQWVVELPGPPDLWRDEVQGLVNWWRGFPIHVIVRGSARELLPVAAAIEETVPVTALVLAALRGSTETMRELVALPLMARIRELYTPRCRFEDAGIALIADAPNCRNLTRLSVFGQWLTDAAGLALADSPYLNAIRHLTLNRHPFSQTVQDRIRARFGDVLRG